MAPGNPKTEIPLKKALPENKIPPTAIGSSLYK